MEKSEQRLVVKDLWMKGLRSRQIHTELITMADSEVRFKAMATLEVILKVMAH
jgi:hypothetical protein